MRKLNQLYKTIRNLSELTRAWGPGKKSSLFSAVHHESWGKDSFISLLLPILQNSYYSTPQRIQCWKGWLTKPAAVHKAQGTLDMSVVQVSLISAYLVR